MGGAGEALRGGREVQSAIVALAELLGQQPRRCSALRSCPSSEPSPERGRFSTSLAPAQRKRSGSLPGSPDVGGGVEGGGPGGTTALWSASQGLPGSGAGAPPCPAPFLRASQALALAHPLALGGCSGHQRRRLPLCASCWVLLGPSCSSPPPAPSTASLEAGSVGTRTQGQAGHPGCLAHRPSLHNSRGTPRTALNDPLEPSSMRPWEEAPL